MWIFAPPKSTPNSAAGDQHVPLDRGDGRGDVEVVPLGLAGDQQVKRRFRAFPIAAAQQLEQFDLLAVAEATVDRACRGHPNAVAAGTEICR